MRTASLFLGIVSTASPVLAVLACALSPLSDWMGIVVLACGLCGIVGLILGIVARKNGGKPGIILSSIGLAEFVMALAGYIWGLLITLQTPVCRGHRRLGSSARLRRAID